MIEATSQREQGCVLTAVRRFKLGVHATFAEGQKRGNLRGGDVNLCPEPSIWLPPDALPQAKGNPQAMTQRRVMGKSKAADDRVPRTVKAGSSVWIWSRTEGGATDMVDRRSHAAKRPPIVGALPEPNMRTRNMKSLPPADVAVKRCSLGWPRI